MECLLPDGRENTSYFKLELLRLQQAENQIQTRKKIKFIKLDISN
jgi:hypothetical protein